MAQGQAGPPPPLFSLLVEGDWGGPGLPKALRNKLLCYFQSPKRSGGGECQLQPQKEGCVWVCFTCEEVRQRVLSKKTHELELGEKGTLKLVVKLPETTNETRDPVPKTKQNQTGKVTEEKITEEKDVQDNITSKLAGENQGHGEDDFTASQISSLVVIENVKESITTDILTLLVENISGLLVQNDFQTELIRERNAAVVTFQRSMDAAKFMDRCTKNSRFKEYKFTARLLELTQMIKVENIPTGVHQDFITLYFESPKHGGGPVSSIKMLPEEESALITFCDNQAVQTVLKKQHSFDHQPISVYPYYSSLDAVLYGKERLQIKMPEPVRVPLDPYIWQFLQGKDKLTQEIDKEMKNCFCDLMWPPVTCEHPEITIHPSSALSKQGTAIRKLIKTWKDKVFTEFACILSKFKTTTCKIIPAEWEKIESNFINNVLAVPDVSKETVTISGFVFNVDIAVNQVNAYIENLTQSAEKARQAIQQTLQIAPRRHAVLHRVLQDDNFYKENSGLKFSYDLSTNVMQLCGMPTEVYKMKSDLLEKLHDMQEKEVTVPAQIFQFLQHVDSQKVSAIIFHANNINAAYDLGPDSVLLVGHSSGDLLKAEEQMKKDLHSKLITLEDPELINKKEWKELVKKLLKKHSSVDEAVIIDDCFVLGEDTKVTIAGYTTAVASVYQELSNFVEKNTRMLKVIPAKLLVVVQFMEEKKGKIWQDLKRKNVKINFGLQAKQKNIVLSGPKAEVMKAAAIVEQMLSLLHSRRVVFDKPGVKIFFKKREHSYISEAKESFHCLIRLQKDEEDDRDSRVKDGHPHAKIQLKDGVVVEACKGDLTCFPVDVVVNASNEDLKHIGGLAGALLKAAGPQLQRDCDDLVRRAGRFKPGCAITTGACNLPCKQVIHAVGPRWSSFENEKCICLLKKAVKESLKQAEKYNHHSIAFPAVSSGIFGFPLKECAHSIVTAIKEHLEESSENNSLKQIYLVDVSENTVQALADALNETFREAPPQPHSVSHSQPASPPAEYGEDFHTVISDEGLKLILQEKGIEYAMTDIVVSSIGSDLKLGVGPLSKALLEKAGPELQAEFDLAVQGQGAQDGCVIQTSGYNLASGVVLHVVVPQWDGGKGHAIKKLKAIMRECLERTEELSLRSISFPAIGTGGFSFPRAEVAKLMFEETLQYSRTKKLKFLQEVHFLLHPKDTDNIQAFSQVFESGTGRIPSGLLQTDGRNEGFFGPISIPVLGIHEMQIGPIKFQTVTGDITKETTDVIVNVTNSSFNAKAASQLHNGFITTQGGNLICKKIIHLAPNADIKTQVSIVLQECEAKKYTSVAFPAIGTGQSGRSPEDAADDMIGAVGDFIGKELPQHLKTIKIVIFQPNMQNAFYASMKTREGSALPTPAESVMTKIKNFIIRNKPPVPKKRLLLLEKKVEVAVFEICGEDRKNVDAAESWLKKLILQEQAENRITDELIDMFDDAEIQKLNELQKRLHIAIQLEKKQSPPFILVSGIPRDVLTAFTEIQDLIKKMKDDREERSKAELAKNLVEWQYSKDGDKYTSVDMLANLHLEDAMISKKMHVNIQIDGKAYMVDLKNMSAHHKGKTVYFKRSSKEEGKVALPKHWEDMKGNRIKLVLLKPTAQEYKDVERKFQQGCPNYKIEQIERVQNPFLWQSYQVKKQELDKKNGHKNNEKMLFHGTPYSTMSPINHTGFNRSYAGKNAAAIGKGTYFAINARYSSQDTYSIPDRNGRKYMYLARVLTGDYCVGNHGMIVPPTKNNGGFDLYDSVTDNVTAPSMFVIFSDAQAYPEYLITFRK
ncbi:protein mono-ADP-ribosyltransferase PARP14-like isoform X2 [Sceloporus undulatus]|uniref:protein mono-ADP-ribosyltransferase PARP14-like isoform X2 n=1 Tax=Sceloporus undulatus TaxID=8520 RepID=UPI001C4DD215|nr:protein mono-ADP-ribosyltransferase PARP14-like isoform X2 [Sceloporus undulatus]